MSAVIRKHEASKEEMHATIEIQLLEVFQILACWQLNRQRMIALGILPALARIMKVCLAGLLMYAHCMLDNVHCVCKDFRPLFQLHDGTESFRHHHSWH